MGWRRECTGGWGGGKDLEGDAEELPPEEQAELDDAAAPNNHDDRLYPAMTDTSEEVTPEIVGQFDEIGAIVTRF